MVTLPVPQAISSTRAPGSSPIRATKASASGAPISLAIAPKSPAIQGARMESFIWSMLGGGVDIYFSKSLTAVARNVKKRLDVCHAVVLSGFG
jgi:hypothetical protein